MYTGVFPQWRWLLLAQYIIVLRGGEAITGIIFSSVSRSEMVITCTVNSSAPTVELVITATVYSSVPKM